MRAYTYFSIFLYLVLFFLVTSTVYAIEEFVDFQLDPSIQKVSVSVGEHSSRELRIRNTGTKDLDFSIDTGELKDLISTENNFRLDVAKEKLLDLDFITTQPGGFTGMLSIKGNSIIKTVPIVLGVESKNPIFDVSSSIPSKFKEVVSGQGLVVQVTLFGLRNGVTHKNVSVNYFIKDFNDNNLLNESNFVYVNDKLDYLKEIKLPPYLKEGDYALFVEAKYDGKTGISSSLFRVVEKRQQLSPLAKSYLNYILLAAVLVTVLILLIFWKTTKTIGGGASRKINPKELEKEKIRKKIALIENSSKLGYISKKQYHGDLNNLQKQLRDLEKK